MPSYTIYEVECPDHSFRKFTEDGQYLISFSRNHQELIVYRPRWLSFSCNDEDCDQHDLPSKARRFDSFFTQLYCVPLASCNELICKDFFLYMESNQFGLFATSTAQIHDAPAVDGAVQGVPSIEKITFHLLRCFLIFLYILNFSLRSSKSKDRSYSDYSHLLYLEWKMERSWIRKSSVMTLLI